jgi:formylglycine-generating enzyme required for sulfatase activity
MKNLVSSVILVLLCGAMYAQQTDPAPQAASEGFVFVEGGTFTMGSPSTEADHYDDEIQHQVTVSSFYMGQYEVTQAEYEAVMGSNPSNFKGENLPVEQVSWYEAIEYCNKRSIQEGLTPAYKGTGDNISCDFKANGYRLPTEAEWEYAARGGKNQQSLQYLYSGSNNADSVAWYWDNSGGKTHPVGTKTANSLGLYDMSGNVWEWCWDWYGSYSTTSQTDPTGAASGYNRVSHGGSWRHDAQRLRSACRDGNSPSNRDYDLGFRLVLCP